MGRKTKRLALWPVAIAATLAFVGSPQAETSKGPGRDFESFQWTMVYDGDWPPPSPATPTTGWAGRAGLQAVELRNRLYVMGGRTPTPFGPPTFDNPFSSKLWNDVWESGDLGASWKKLATPPAGQNMWAERGYFQAVTKGGAMFVLGGQDFTSAPNPNCTFPPAVPQPECPPFQLPSVPTSTFFNDVWRSTDGTTWTQLTANAPWPARAGLSAIEFRGWIYVLGGSNGDDVAVGGQGRTLFDDVWRSRDGTTWESVTTDAPWPARAGAALVEKNGYLYLLGGEDGFLCTFGPTGPTCPYFNDVWRSRDGATWERVTEHAGWSARPGHQCQALLDTIVCFGGFGFPTDPSGTVAAHPVDAWVSRDGASWEKLEDGPWNATASADVKYDFDSLVVTGGPGGLAPSIYTFGGDREASFIAPNPALVDDEVWRFSPARPAKR